MASQCWWKKEYTFNILGIDRTTVTGLDSQSNHHHSQEGDRLYSKAQLDLGIMTTSHNISYFMVLHGDRAEIKSFIVAVIRSHMSRRALRNIKDVYDVAMGRTQ